MITIRAHNYSTKWLYDTGANETLISDEIWDLIDPKGELKPYGTPLNLRSASSTPIICLGTYLINISATVDGVRRTAYQCKVGRMKNLSHAAILGTKNARRLGLKYDITEQLFGWGKQTPPIEEQMPSVNVVHWAPSTAYTIKRVYIPANSALSLIHI